MRGCMENYVESLTPEESYVFHYYVSCECGISVEEKRFYIQMLRQTQDFMDSKQDLLLNGPTSFKIIFMHFKNDEEGNILFNGAISNGEENRCVDGVIKHKGKRYYVLNHVHRLGEDFPEWMKEYYVYDTFKTIEDRWYQETIYDNSLEYRQRYGESKSIKRRIAGIDLSTYDEFQRQYVDMFKGATK